MAIRGAKPKPAFLKLVAGNPGKRPIGKDIAETVPATQDNGLRPPVKLGSRQRQLWDQYVRRAPWLKPFDAPRAFMWVSLHEEFEQSPGDMVAGRIAQLRALGSELGFDPASRSRIGAGRLMDDNEDETKKYF